MTTRAKFSKQQTGKWGEDRAQQWLLKRRFMIVHRNWRPPRGQGLGEIDIVALRAPAELWLFEVKTHAWWGGASGQSLLSQAQSTRLLRSRLWWKRRYPSSRVRVGLLWMDPLGASVQFLEISCYS